MPSSLPLSPVDKLIRDLFRQTHDLGTLAGSPTMAFAYLCTQLSPHTAQFLRYEAPGNSSVFPILHAKILDRMYWGDRLVDQDELTRQLVETLGPRFAGGTWHQETKVAFDMINASRQAALANMAGLFEAQLEVLDLQAINDGAPPPPTRPGPRI